MNDKYFYVQDELEGNKEKRTNMKAVLLATDLHGDVNDGQQCLKYINFTES